MVIFLILCLAIYITAYNIIPTAIGLLLNSVISYSFNCFGNSFHRLLIYKPSKVSAYESNYKKYNYTSKANNKVFLFSCMPFLACFVSNKRNILHLLFKVFNRVLHCDTAFRGLISFCQFPRAVRLCSSLTFGLTYQPF